MKQRLAIILEKKSYAQKIRSFFGSSLLAYWPLNETSGTVAYDRSVNGRNGTYTSVTLADTQSPNGKPAPRLSTTQLINLSSAAPFTSGIEGTMGGFFRPFNVGVWTDATIRLLMYLYKDANNRIMLRKEIANNTLTIYHIAGATIKNNSFLVDTTKWAHYAITWAAPPAAAKLYINGILATSIGSLGTFSDTPSVLSAASAASLGSWNGWASDFFYVNRPATPSELRVSASGNIRTLNISTIGDSITAWNTSLIKWTGKLADVGLNSGYVAINNHAVAGENIMAHMDAQVAAASTDNADVIIIHMGRNDNNYGDMVALQAEVEENLVKLLVSNPNARIYVMNVLPSWTDSTGVTEVELGNIRTAIAAACTAQSITCWDTYNEPWIIASDTSDGVHPIAAGHVKVAIQIAARL